MFRKLISNLPFNPSLIGEVAFYFQRIKKEEQIRRLGFILLALSMVLQLFAVASPPQSTLAESDNDIIKGGFSTRDQAVLHCIDPQKHFDEILAHFGVTCDILANASTRWIKSTDYNKRLDSMGRHQKGDVISRTGKPTNEYPVGIGGTTFWMRNLWAFDSGSYSSYKVLEMKNIHGQTIFVMYNCGNIVTIDKYEPPKEPEPKTTPEPTPTPQPEPQPQPEPVEPADACPNKQGDQNENDNCDVCPNRLGTQLLYEECDACPNVPGEQSSSNECYPCPEAQDDSSITACLSFEKSASNLTQDIDDADGTMAKAGDVITYELRVKNEGSQEVRDFQFTENLYDVLQYSDIKDIDGGTIEGSALTWPAESIGAGQTAVKTFSVQVKNPIPETPVSVSDTTAYDLVMTNVFFGESVNIELPQSVAKTVESVTNALPKTGPGDSILFMSVAATIAGYFLARARLLQKETAVIRSHFATEGEA